jgi:hypothetical protein
MRRVNSGPPIKLSSPAWHLLANPATIRGGESNQSSVTRTHDRTLQHA